MGERIKFKYRGIVGTIPIIEKGPFIIVLISILIFIVFEVTVILYLLQYARRVKKDPKKSILYGEERTLIFPFKQKEAVITVRQKICLMLFVFTIAMTISKT